jgi:uncharacterized protein (TIGR02246 family)
MNDEQLIRNALGRWCQSVDDGDAEAVGQTWTEDGSQTTVALQRTLKGRQAIVDFFGPHFEHRTRSGVTATKHWVANTEIHCDGDTAWVSSDFVSARPTEGSTLVSFAGRFVDRFVKEGSDWLILERSSYTGRCRPRRDKAAELRASKRSRTDEEGIMLRLVQYIQSLKDGRLDDLTDCWTEEGSWTVGSKPPFNGKRYEGRSAIREFIAPYTAEEGDFEVGGGHLIANAVIEVDGDRARATTDILTIAWRDDRWNLGGSTGRYVDELVRDSDQVWRFTDRRNATEQW